MEKRLFIAVIISIALLWAWGALVPKLFPELARKPVAQKQPASPAPAAPKGTPATASSASPAVPGSTAVAEGAATPAPALPPTAGAAPVTTIVETPEYEARFSNIGAELISFRLKGYRTKNRRDFVDLVRQREPGRHDYPFAIQSGNPALDTRLNSAVYQVTDSTSAGTRTIEYRYVGPDGIGMTKTFRMAANYEFDFTTQLIGHQMPYSVTIGPGMRTLDPDEVENRFAVSGNGVVQRDGSAKVFGREKVKTAEVFQETPEFIGIEDNYFLVALKPIKASGAALRPIQVAGRSKDEKARRELYAAVGASPEGTVSGHAFFGPMQADLLEKHGLQKALQFGVFGLIARFLLRALIWLYTLTKNYGWAIIVLTILIKVVLYPLQHKSIVSMKKMQALQPKVNALRDKYRKSKTDADQRQKLNVEMMKLYKQEGVNPMGGCLPILLQLPILWAFYSLLSHAIELRSAPFVLWITDLSAKDPYYITPILMTITMFIQQWVTPSTVDPAQRRMFLMMPLVFGWIFKEFPSGLVLYWLVQNILTIAQQLIMNRWWKEHPAELKVG